MTGLRRAAAALAALVLAPAAVRAQIPADAHFTTVTTPHFRVHYAPGLETLARRAGVRAEEAYGEITAALVRPPRGRIDLVVTDNVDYSNGFTTPFPRNRIVIFAHPPVDDPSLAYYDDWLDLVITHELTHSFHLDYARGLVLVPRYVFGRSPLSFPETTTPAWTKEGLAVYLESRLTRAGRLRGTMHEMELRTAVLQGRFFPIDRASGDPVSWPSGNAPYLYGSEFIQYLSDRFGPEKAGEFVRRYGGYVIPFLNDVAARRTYGVSFSRAWSEWRASLEARYRAEADSLRSAGVTEPTILTPAGRGAEFPRWSPDGRWIAYAAATGREQPEQRLVDADGHERILAPRTSLAPESWAPDGSLVTSMIDLRDPFRAYSDLYRITPSGDVRRLTHGARLLDPHVSRDGRTVAIRSGGGTTVPVLVDADGAVRELAAPSLDVHWAFPRWSPDGRRIAISRWRYGGFYDVVVLDDAGRVVREATNDRAVDLAPAWSPDGRWVLFSSDRSGIANLYAFGVDDGRTMQVTNVLTGAFQPDVSPDGRWIAFQLYMADGYHVARIPFDPSAWRPAAPVSPRFAPSPQPAASRMTEAPAHAYRAWRSVLPAYWQPTIYTSGDFGTALGIGTSGNDVIERHLWAAGGQVYTRDRRFEGGVGYLFRGLGNPTLGLSAYQDWKRFATFQVGQAPDGSPLFNDLLERDRSYSAVATFARPRFRSYAWLSLAANLQSRLREWSDPLGDTIADFRDAPPQVGGIATLGWSTARSYDYSISTQDGLVAAASVEGRRNTRPRVGETGYRGYTRVDGRFQAYHGFDAWGFARHVLALRATGGADFGTTPYFTVGGTLGNSVAFPLGTGTGLGSSPDLFVRGYASDAQIGDRAAAATAEWRFPIALVERGYRLVPVFLNRVWGTAFVDAGSAWCVQGCDPQIAKLFDRPDPLVSAGAELGTDLFVGMNVGMQLRGGFAVPLRAADTVLGNARPKPKFYLTVGQSF
jgi:Tol biopolymer transport system component